jgi:beta-glucanase (GH16 family)
MPRPAPTATPLPTATTIPTATAIVAPVGWKLVWHDEFDGPAGAKPDPAKWGYDIGNGVNGWGNAEDESYTDSADNAALDGQGSLLITARTEPLTTSLNCWNGPCAFTSARLLTKGKFDLTYGRVEARLRLPFGQGVWPAFWMLGSNIDSAGWPGCGELDVMENVGREPNVVHGSAHGLGYSGGGALTGKFILPRAKFSDGFHVFAVEWEPKEIRWYVDGQQYFSAAPADVQLRGDWAFDHPFFILLNLAVGGGWPGDPDETTTFPQTYAVDYVRVFQK